MNAPLRKSEVKLGYSACPHDCPSTCALEVELKDARTIGRVHGAEDNRYTAGVVCAKVARYEERVHHPDRLRVPLQRVGEKGEGRFREISWTQALDEVAEQPGDPCLRQVQRPADLGDEVTERGAVQSGLLGAVADLLLTGGAAHGRPLVCCCER